MQDEFVALINLVEEYKAHCTSADADIRMLRAHIDELNDKISSYEHKNALWQEMEESVVHMDREMASIKRELVSRNLEVEELQEQLYRSQQSEKSMSGSISVQHSATKDDLNRALIKNEILQTNNDELEELLSAQQSDMIEMKFYIKELESSSYNIPQTFGSNPYHSYNKIRSDFKRESLGKKSATDHIKYHSLRSPTSPSKPATVSDIDIDVGIESYGSNKKSNYYHESPLPAKAIAVAAAAAARQLAQPDQVKNINNRGDGSFGFPSPRRKKKTILRRGNGESDNKERATRTIAAKVQSNAKEIDDIVTAFDFDSNLLSSTLPKPPPKENIRNPDEIDIKGDDACTDYKYKERKEKEVKTGFVRPKTLRA